MLLLSHSSAVRALRTATRVVTFDGEGHLILRDADTLAVLRHDIKADGVKLAGSTLAYRKQGQLHVVDANDGSTLSTCPVSGPGWGLAEDGQSVWVAEGSLELRELDCGVRWSVAGAYTGARVLAVGDALHVFDADVDPAAVVRHATSDGASTSTPFQGSFTSWFENVPRFWTHQGAAFRVYDTDGALLMTDLGAPTFGWGTHLVFGVGVIDVLTKAQVGTLPQGSQLHSGPAVLVLGQANELWRIDQDPVVGAPFVTPCCIPNGDWTFTWAPDGFVLGTGSGIAVDQLGRRLADGAVVGLAGAEAGRVAIGLRSDVVRTYDIGKDCTMLQHPDFPRTGRRLWMSGDGGLLLSEEFYSPWWASPPCWGTRFYGLPEGVLLASSTLGGSSYSILDHEVAYDGSLWSRTWANVSSSYGYTGQTFPFGQNIGIDGLGNVPPTFPPNAAHAVVTESQTKAGESMANCQSYVYDPFNFAAVYDGVTHGLLDDEHALVSRYVGQGNVFAGSEIVDLAGVVVQPTTLPELRKFQRIGTGEILGYKHPGKDAAIYNPWTGEALWTGPPGMTVVAVGPDHVAIGDGAFVTLVRWR